jgi:poly(A) polymerase
VIFPGHDVRGAHVSEEILGRLRASTRLRSHVAGLAEHHLRLGFLVHRQPLDRRAVYGYLHACDPLEVDVTLVSVADRLATRGDRAQEAIDRHVELARAMLGEALRWRAAGPPPPLVRGDRLADALGIPAGPELGPLLAELAAAQFAGEVQDEQGAIAWARTWRQQETRAAET